MQLPFTVEQFFAVFERYNSTVWPAQLALLVAALAAVVQVARPRLRSGRLVSLILSALWAWVGVVYHASFFLHINRLAYAFAALSLLGSFAFLWFGVVRRRVRFEPLRGWRAWAGWSMVIYALLVYPAWLRLSGHAYFASPTFGVPCPTTIFTLGLLALAAPPTPRALFVVPLLWSLVGGQAAFLLSVPQDVGLLAAGVVGAIVALPRRPPANRAPAARESR
jgi:hypothetical protein